MYEKEPENLVIWHLQEQTGQKPAMLRTFTKLYHKVDI